MKCFMRSGNSKDSRKGVKVRMQELKAVFENEEAVRLLNYFISYKEIINKSEKHPIDSIDDTLKIAVLPKSELLVVK